MTSLNAISFAQKLGGGGLAPPVCLLLGDDNYLRDEALRAIELQVVEPATRDFNVERFTAGECSVDSILSACRMSPMMASKRLVMVRSLERWESEGAATHLDALAEYAKSPVETTSLVLLAERMHGSRRLVTLAKKEGWLVDAGSLSPEDVAQAIVRLGQARGKVLSTALARALVELAGTDLATLEDAVERMCLYAADVEVLTDQHMRASVVRLRQGDAWDLVAAVGTRDPAATLRAFANSFEPKDRGLPLVGALAWSVRQMLRVHEGVAAGQAPEAAARAAGAYSPQKSRELLSAAKRFRPSELSEFLTALAQADRDLKGAKRPAKTTLEALLLRFSLPRAAS